MPKDNRIRVCIRLRPEIHENLTKEAQEYSMQLSTMCAYLLTNYANASAVERSRFRGITKAEMLAMAPVTEKNFNNE